MVNGYKFDIENTYSVALPSYLSRGGDGYEFLKDLTVLKDEIQTTSLLNLIMKFFSTLNEQLKKEL
jgi:2',3'-cyclic-nucleotide 2'-phosphodiesterase (5'-nucleotidase family)